MSAGKELTEIARPDSEKDGGKSVDSTAAAPIKQQKVNKFSSPEKQDADLSYMPPAVRAQSQKMIDEVRSFWKCYPRIIIDLQWLPWLRAVLRTAIPALNNPKRDRESIATAVRRENPGTVVTTLSVRTFMDCMFRVMKFPEGSEIIMTGITIPHVIDIIKYHKLVPRVVDLDVISFTPDMNVARSLVNEKTKMLIAAPVFGRTMTKLSELKQLAAESKIPFVIDAAQCFGIQQHIDALDADVTCCSYGFIKYSTALGGSVNIVKDVNLANKIKELEATLPTRSTGKQAGNMLKSFAVLFVDDPITYGVVRRLAESAGLDTPDLVHKATRGFPGNELIPLIRFRPHPACLSLLSERMNNKDPKVNLIRSISGWHFLSQMPNYVQSLSAGNTERPEECTFWLHAFVCKDPLVVCKILHQSGFDASLGASQMAAVGTPEEAPICHAAIKNILYVPLPVEMAEEDRQRVVKLFHEMPKIALESPLDDFHKFVATTAEKHAYRSPQVAALLKKKPTFKDPVSSLVMMTGGPIAAALVSKL